MNADLITDMKPACTERSHDLIHRVLHMDRRGKVTKIGHIKVE